MSLGFSLGWGKVGVADFFLMLSCAVVIFINFNKMSLVRDFYKAQNVVVFFAAIMMLFISVGMIIGAAHSSSWNGLFQLWVFLHKGTKRDIGF